MKKTLFYSVLATFTLFTLASCEKEQIIDLPNQGSNYTVEANIERPISDTKVNLGTQTDKFIPIVWSPKDRISVSDGIEYFQFTASSVDSTNATFVGPQYGKVPDSTFVIKEAYYPAIYNTEGKLDMKKNQYYIKTTKLGNGIPMYATMKNGKLAFQPLTAILKLSITGKEGEALKSIIITSEDKISGKCYLDYETLALDWDLDAGNEIVYGLSKSYGGLSSTPRDFYITIPPTTSKKFKVTLISHDGKRMVRTTKESDANVFHRGKLKEMPTINFDGKMPRYIENGVDLGEGIRIANKTWAPVNCGSGKGYAYGKLYQWGRKEGQGYNSADETYPTADNILPNIAYGQIPLAQNFYQGEEANAFAWMGRDSKGSIAFADYTKWNDLGKPGDIFEKNTGIGNPCPQGWRLPTGSELSLLTKYKSAWSTVNGQNGLWCFGNIAPKDEATAPKLFLPAAGHRNVEGSALERGEVGYYWSTEIYCSYTKTSSFGKYFKFDKNTQASENLKNNGDGKIAEGMAVRCIFNE